MSWDGFWVPESFSRPLLLQIVAEAWLIDGSSQKVAPHFLYRRVLVMECPRSLPSGASGKEPACQCRRCKRRRFDPWVRKIPWRKAWQSTPVFLLGKSRGQRSLAGCSPWRHRESTGLSNWRCYTTTNLNSSVLAVFLSLTKEIYKTPLHSKDRNLQIDSWVWPKESSNK